MSRTNVYYYYYYFCLIAWSILTCHAYGKPQSPLPNPQPDHSSKMSNHPLQNSISSQKQGSTQMRPTKTTVFSDLNVITFDDLKYTFNGKGDFVMVHADSEEFKFDVQGRFEQMPNNTYGQVKSTMLISVVTHDNISAVIEVRLRPKVAQWRYMLDVFADGKRLYFDKPALKVQHFHGVTVYKPSNILDQSKIMVMFQSGAELEVYEHKGFMATLVFVPKQFMNHTRGLFGNGNFSSYDNFPLTNGQWKHRNTSDSKRDRRESGSNWILDDKNEQNKGGAMFFRKYGRTASNYVNQTFKQFFENESILTISSNSSVDLNKIYELCGVSNQCIYNNLINQYKAEEFKTLENQLGFLNIKLTQRPRVISCGILKTPRSERKSNFLFVSCNTTVTFKCNQGFVLEGYQHSFCSADGKWDIPENGITICRRLDATWVEIFFNCCYLVLLVICVRRTVLWIFHWISGWFNFCRQLKDKATHNLDAYYKGQSGKEDQSTITYWSGHH